ncbi:IS5/IS1182 family transposase, partial [Acinetobacter baumannii]|nr:IS5/IS1182 family transposase [Acinetobacter baumannii]MDI9668800.1 IS5/IS1182 family transposase [Acinetobacter baumannii]
MNKSTPKINRKSNWSAYNRALINRGKSAIWVDPATQWVANETGKQGRNQT